MNILKGLKAHYALLKHQGKTNQGLLWANILILVLCSALAILSVVGLGVPPIVTCLLSVLSALLYTTLNTVNHAGRLLIEGVEGSAQYLEDVVKEEG